MDKNRDGVVTIEEFIETCQKVTFSQRPTYKQTSETKWKLLINTNTLLQVRAKDKGVLLPCDMFRHVTKGTKNRHTPVLFPLLC